MMYLYRTLALYSISPLKTDVVFNRIQMLYFPFLKPRNTPQLFNFFDVYLFTGILKTGEHNLYVRLNIIVLKIKLIIYKINT